MLHLSPLWKLKTQNGRFPCKIALCLKKVCYKVSLCEIFQRQSCKAFIALTIHANIISGGRPLLCKNLVDADPPTHLQIVNFRSIFACSASAITRSENISINTNRKSTMRFPVSLR